MLGIWDFKNSVNGYNKFIAKRDNYDIHNI